VAAPIVPSSPFSWAMSRSKPSSIYLQADMRLKEQALAKTSATDSRVHRYHPSDRLLEFLNAL
jgi:hypothetical protein